jgi:hypothetical protein
VREFAFAGRTMQGWVLVDGEILDEQLLAGCIADARRFVASLKAK